MEEAVMKAQELVPPCPQLSEADGLAEDGWKLPFALSQESWCPVWELVWLWLELWQGSPFPATSRTTCRGCSQHSLLGNLPLFFSFINVGFYFIFIIKPT